VLDKAIARRRRHKPAAVHGSLPVYRGRFGTAQAERLLWRAGFGPRPGDCAKVAALGMRRAVLSLTRPASHALVGPAPHIEKGQPLAPYDVWGNDVLWWLDRMVRSRAQLIERMTLTWHDWFATSNEGVNSQRMMIDQNRTQRRLCLSTFPRMLTAMTSDPAMQVWLSLSGSTKQAPNENYAREMQELFSLGVGNGYTEEDVRQHARALTGWTNTWNQSTGQPQDFHFDPTLHDDGVKTIYHHTGRFGWRDSLRLLVHHPDHPASSSPSSGPTSAPSPCPRPTPRPRRRCMSHRAARSARSWKRCSCTRSSTRDRGWSSRRSSRSPGCCARSDATSTPTPGPGSRASSARCPSTRPT
jgi:hypothetical protein